MQGAGAPGLLSISSDMTYREHRVYSFVDTTTELWWTNSKIRGENINCAEVCHPHFEQFNFVVLNLFAKEGRHSPSGTGKSTWNVGLALALPASMSLPLALMLKRTMARADMECMQWDVSRNVQPNMGFTNSGLNGCSSFCSFLFPCFKDKTVQLC